MRRDVQAIMLVLLGGAVLRISAGDVYLRYVKASMKPWLLISGGILIALGVLMLIDVLRASRTPHDDDHVDAALPVGAGARAETDLAHPMAPDLHDVDPFDGPVDDRHAHDAGWHGLALDDGHGHGTGGPRSAWLLLLPVLAIFLIGPPALGSFTAERQQTSVLAPADQAPPLPPGDPVTLTLSDYAARAVWDDGRTLVGRTVSMTGFASPDGKGGWYLTRLQLTCCAADAVVTKIQPKDVKPLPANTWVTVLGTWVPGGGTQSDTAIPWVKVSSLTQVSAPKDPYE